MPSPAGITSSHSIHQLAGTRCGVGLLTCSGGGVPFPNTPAQEKREMSTSKQSSAPQPVLPVLDGEEPWTDEEVAEQRAELQDELERLERRIAATEAELDALLRGGTDGAGRDPADVGSINFERDQELSLAQNVREMAEQLRLAIHLFDNGEYGFCEICGNPIGKGRLQVFPRATLCVTCKQREERR